MTDIPDRVAIVGMSIRTAGATGPDEFRRLLTQGRSGRRVLTHDELSRRGVPYHEYTHPDYVPVVHPVPGALDFDPEAFGFGPAEAELTDPQHRMLLRACYRAVESAGHRIDALPGVVGVYAGLRPSNYRTLIRQQLRNRLDTLEATRLLLGTVPDYLASQVAYRFGLGGPAITVATACSTSAVAIHLAAQAILAGECDSAVAGGVAIDPEDAGYLHSEGGIFSRRGRCEPFTATADGTVDGNGVAVLFLRRLELAIEDGDPILAVVAGTAVNNDARDRAGFTAPSRGGQAAVISEALDVAELKADAIGMFEAHGTGTGVGDPLELEAATLAFRQAGGRSRDCALSAIKANVGHLTAAAGAAGVIGCLLAMRHERIHPHLPSAAGAEPIDLAGTPFRLSADIRPWPRGAEPRYAAISSFGLGGTNAHLVIGDPDPAWLPERGRRRCWQLLPVSADDPERLWRTVAAVREAARSAGADQRQDLAHTLRVGRPGLRHRRSLLLPIEGEPPAPAGSEASEASEASDVPGVPGSSDGSVAMDAAPGLLLLLPGQGGRGSDAAHRLYGAEPVFAAAVDSGLEIASETLDAETFSRVRQAFTEGRNTDDTLVAQPVSHLRTCGVQALLSQVGIGVQAVAGLSVGEVTGAYLAGVLSFADGVRAVCHRAREMAAMPVGEMYAVRATTEELTASGELPGDAEVAVHDTSSLVVSVGSGSAAALREWLDRKALAYQRLETSHAFHHATMAPAAERFAARMRKLTLGPPRLPLISGRTGDWLRPEQARDPDYWAAQLREPIAFAQGMRTLAADYPNAVCLQLGTDTSLLRAARQVGLPPARCVTVFPREPEQAAACLPRLVGELWERGVPVDWDAYAGADRGLRTAAPPRPFRDTPTLHPALTGQTPGFDPEELTARTAAGRPPDRPLDRVSGPDPTAEIDPELVPLLETVQRCWAQVLGGGVPAPDRDFFDAGGDSIVATRLATRLRAVFEVDIPLALPLTSGTPLRLARAVDELLVEAVTRT